MRRRKRGLIIGSVVAIFALALFIGYEYLSYRQDVALIAASAEGDGNIYGMQEEESFVDYLLPFRGDPANVTMRTVTAVMKAYDSDACTTEITGVTPGTVTPASVSEDDGGRAGIVIIVSEITAEIQ